MHRHPRESGDLITANVNLIRVILRVSRKRQEVPDNASHFRDDGAICAFPG